MGSGPWNIITTTLFRVNGTVIIRWEPSKKVGQRKRVRVAIIENYTSQSSHRSMYVITYHIGLLHYLEDPFQELKTLVWSGTITKWLKCCTKTSRFGFMAPKTIKTNS